MNEEEYNEKINDMEEYNIKWLQYMSNVDTSIHLLPMLLV